MLPGVGRLDLIDPLSAAWPEVVAAIAAATDHPAAAPTEPHDVTAPMHAERRGNRAFRQ